MDLTKNKAMNALLSATLPLAITGVLVLVAILIDMKCSSPYHFFGIQLEYPNAPLAEKISHLCIVLAALVSCFIMGSYCQSFNNYYIAFGCWILSLLIIYVGAKIIANSLVIIFRWQDFVNGKA